MGSKYKASGATHRILCMSSESPLVGFGLFCILSIRKHNIYRGHNVFYNQPFLRALIVHQLPY